MKPMPNAINADTRYQLSFTCCYQLLVVPIILAIILFPPNLYADNVDQLKSEVEILKTEIEKLKQKTERKTKSLSERVNNMREMYRIHGFITAAMATRDSEAVSAGISNESITTQADSILGLQLELDINRKARATIQLVSEGLKEHNTATEWAYITYDLNKRFDLRGGRIRQPLYMLSESLKVRYTYPWVRPPLEVYNLDSNNAELFDVIYRNNLGNNIQLKAQAYIGRIAGTQKILESTLDFASDNTFGFRLEASSSNLLYVMGVHRSKLSYDSDAFRAVDEQFLNLGIDTISAKKASAYYYNLGAMYNDGVYQVYAEAVKIGFDRSLLPRPYGGYISFARSYGAWQPFIVLGKANTPSDRFDSALNVIQQDAPLLAPLAERFFNSISSKQKTVSVGVRWDVMRGLAVKMQIDRSSGFGSTNGLNFTPLDEFGLPTGLRDDHIFNYSLSMDAVF